MNARRLCTLLREVVQGGGDVFIDFVKIMEYQYSDTEWIEHFCNFSDFLRRIVTDPTETTDHEITRNMDRFDHAGVGVGCFDLHDLRGNDDGKGVQTGIDFRLPGWSREGTELFSPHSGGLPVVPVKNGRRERINTIAVRDLRPFHSAWFECKR